MTMPWSNQAVSLVVIEAAGGDFVGLFVYSGPPAFGNLIYSVAPSTVTADPFGNTVYPGATSYGIGQYLEIDGALITFSGSGSNTAGVISAAFSDMIQIVSPRSGTNLQNSFRIESDAAAPYEVGGPLVARVFAAGQPQQGEAWKALPLTNGWSNASASDTQAQYRLLPWGVTAGSGVAGTLEIIGRVAHSGTSGTSAFTTALALPYIPAGTITGARWSSELTIMTATNVYASSTAQTRVRFDSTGILEFESLPSGTSNVYFHCFFNLDAGN